jgi:hypothetical protein
MLRAFQTFELGTDTEILNPNNLAIPLVHHYDMAEVTFKIMLTWIHFSLTS